MRWVRDRTGRFAQRPHYDLDELDAECEALILSFLVARNGQVNFPIDTDDIVALLESLVKDFDPYADLSKDGTDVEGATAFLRGSLPSVKISRHLHSPSLINRLRTTLTHELGHVHFHSCLYGLDVTDDLFEPAGSTFQPICHRDSIIGAQNADWMEWQAGYACGAFLMPAIDVRKLVRDAAASGPSSPPPVGSEMGEKLIGAVMHRYSVSHDAGRVRLLVLGHLSA